MANGSWTPSSLRINSRYKLAARASIGGEHVLKTAFTAFVSAIIGGLVATFFFYLGILGLEEGSEGLSINEAQQATPGEGVNPGGGDGPSVREVYTRDGPGVVTVDVRSVSIGPGGGSGFVIDERGYLVTNQHVVEGADSVSVRFSSGARQEAEVVGEDASTDVAVLRVEAPEETLVPLTLGDSDSVGVGDPVIAVGNPLNVGISVTTGIVSGLGRPIDAPNGYTISGAVQTDAALSSGNSGGPLLDAKGEVIGVNSLTAAAPGFGIVSQGLNFAVPINTVKSVSEQIIETGTVQHGYIGVRILPVGIGDLAAYSGLSSEELSEQHGLPESGAIIREVTEGGPADEAGLTGGEEREEEIAGLTVPLGDVVTEVEGEPVVNPDDVSEVVNSTQPGDELTLTIVTPGEEPREVVLTVGVQPDER
jgi:S1-C subfamily serine protease